LTAPTDSDPLAPSGGLDVRIVDDVDRTFRQAWSALAAAAENPFSTPEWHEAWLRTQTGTSGLVVSIYRGAELVGVLPLVVRRRWGFGVLRAPGGDLGDFSGPASLPVHARAVGEAVCAALPSLLGPRDMLLVERCLHGSGWQLSLAEAETESTSPVVVRSWRSDATLVEALLPRGGSPLRRGRDRREIDRLARRLDQQHGVRLRMSGTADVERDLLALLHLRRSRWDAAPRPSEEAFLLDVAHSASEAGFLRLWLLDDNDRVVAGLLGWSLSGRTFAHLMAFDGAYAKLGPGTVLLARAVESAVTAGDRVFDFLRGDEAHKRAYVTQQRTVGSYVLARRGSLAAALVRGADGVQLGYQRLPASWQRRAQVLPTYLRRAEPAVSADSRPGRL